MMLNSQLISMLLHLREVEQLASFYKRIQSWVHKVLEQQSILSCYLDPTGSFQDKYSQLKLPKEQQIHFSIDLTSTSILQRNSQHKESHWLNSILSLIVIRLIPQPLSQDPYGYLQVLYSHLLYLLFSQTGCKHLLYLVCCWFLQSFESIILTRLQFEISILFHLLFDSILLLLCQSKFSFNQFHEYLLLTA